MSKPLPPASIPQAAPTSKGGAFVANYTYNKGDVVHSAAGNGWWVCTANHVSGNAHTLMPGQSNDVFHWSVGPS